ncbi:class I SAM-dependent methyltransferase [Solimonas sp. SE-A11]|uniref:class I SAM-dependent methyltransferase n=1 Tax=Solimonas sp. SE-A11 TaxID=3054954 RepID=UPI00259CB8DB|nr:class I SAM-dependent methyltransferase [Solimonas sp. SE-A11]MDM4772398.1 class I SAM-dependent methyltransferase [Solimonas sp. SE-A11]
MTTAPAPEEGQAALWNGVAGQAWVDAQGVLDHMFRPLEQHLADIVAASPGRVLDVGCGTGATTCAFARQGAPCLGVDISAPMIAVARERAQREGLAVEFACADAQAHPFEPSRFDWIVSRFGVMFFDDPVQAFAKLHRAARHDGRLCLVAWRGATDNPFMTTAERAAAPLLPQLPPRRSGAPGQFAFAEPGPVLRILEDSGWRDVDIRPLDVACRFPERDLLLYLSRLGPVGRVLQKMDEPTRNKVIATIRAAFEPYVHADTVRFDAACWKISGRAA